MSLIDPISRMKQKQKSRERKQQIKHKIKNKIFEDNHADSIRKKAKTGSKTKTFREEED